MSGAPRRAADVQKPLIKAKSKPGRAGVACPLMRGGGGWWRRAGPRSRGAGAAPRYRAPAPARACRLDQLGTSASWQQGPCAARRGRGSSCMRADGARRAAQAAHSRQAARERTRPPAAAACGRTLMMPGPLSSFLRVSVRDAAATTATRPRRGGADLTTAPRARAQHRPQSAASCGPSRPWECALAAPASPACACVRRAARRRLLRSCAAPKASTTVRARVCGGCGGNGAGTSGGRLRKHARAAAGLRSGRGAPLRCGWCQVAGAVEGAFAASHPLRRRKRGGPQRYWEGQRPPSGVDLIYIVVVGERAARAHHAGLRWGHRMHTRGEGFRRPRGARRQRRRARGRARAGARGAGRGGAAAARGFFARVFMPLHTYGFRQGRAGRPRGEACAKRPPARGAGRAPARASH